MIHGTPAIEIDNSFATTTLTRNSIEGYFVGLKQGSHVATMLHCNHIENNYIGVSLWYNATIRLNNATKGSNRIVNQKNTNFYFYFSYVPFSEIGGNAFFNHHEQGIIFSGTINNYFCDQGSDDNPIFVTQNCWKENDCSLHPQSEQLSDKFMLHGFHETTCIFCDAQNIDPVPQPYPDCGSVEVPVLPGGLGNLSSCPTCPRLLTSHFQGTPLDVAVHQAINLTSAMNAQQGDDEQAAVLFQEIFTFPYPVKNPQTFAFLLKAYWGAKDAAMQLIQQDKLPQADALMQTVYQHFQPDLFPGHTPTQQLIVALEQAQYLHGTGKTPQAMELLYALQDTPSPHQNLVQDYIQQFLADEAFDPEQAQAYIDSTGGEPGIIYEEFDPNDCLEGNEYQQTYLHALQNGELQPGTAFSPKQKTEQQSTLGSKTVKKLTLFPSPTSGMVYFNLPPKITIREITVVSTLGKTVKTSTQNQTGQGKIDLSTLQKGVYFILFTDQHRTQYIQNVVVE